MITLSRSSHTMIGDKDSITLVSIYFLLESYYDTFNKLEPSESYPIKSNELANDTLQTFYELYYSSGSYLDLLVTIFEVVCKLRKESFDAIQDLSVAYFICSVDNS